MADQIRVKNVSDRPLVIDSVTLAPLDTHDFELAGDDNLVLRRRLRLEFATGRLISLTGELPGEAIPPDDSVSTAKIQDGSVTNEKMHDGAVTSRVILDGSISQDKLDFTILDAALLDTEIADREAGDSDLQDNIDTEAASRAAAVTAEASTRASADTTLQSNITSEASSRASADTAEASVRASADTTLQSNITSEASSRASADSAEASTRAADDATEASARAAAVTAEASARASADTAEASARAAADTSEASTRATADTAEASARAAADTNLETQGGIFLTTGALTISASPVTITVNRPTTKLSTRLIYVIDPYTTSAEVVTATAISGSTITAPALIKNHSSGAIVLARDPGPWVLDWFGADPTGVADTGPRLQDAYAQGARTIWFTPAASYSMQTPFFDDSTSRTLQTRLLGNGASLVLGTSLPTSAEFEAALAARTDAPATGVKWAIFSNTSQSALSGGVVTSTGNDTAASGPRQRPRLVIEGLKADGTAITTAGGGFVMGNRLTLKMTDVVGRGMRVLMSWTGYTDGNHLDNYSMVSPAADAWALYALDNGDSVYVGHGVGIGTGARLYKTHGAELFGGVFSSYYFEGTTRAATLHGGHTELDSTGAVVPFATFDGAAVDVEGGEVFVPKANQSTIPGVFVFNDSNVTDFDAGSHVRINGTSLRTWYRSTGDTYETQDGGRFPDLYFKSVGPNSTFTFTDLRPVVAGTGFANDTDATANNGLYIVSDDSSVTSAISGAYALLAHDWTLKKVNGSWAVVPASGGPIRIQKKVAPTFTSLATSSEVDMGGTLTNGTTYEYTMAVYDEIGGLSAYGTVRNAAAGSTGVLKIKGTMLTAGLLIVWRSDTGAGTVVSSATKFWTAPFRNGNFILYDTGANMNKTPWRTVAFAPIPSRSASDGTVDGWKFPVSGTTFTIPLSGNLDFNSHKGTNVTDPTSAQDAATKNYVDTRTLNSFAVPTADVSLNSHKLTSVTDPSSAQDAATKAYVDGRTLNQFVAPTADLSINSHKLTSVTDPGSAQDAATKNYVDGRTLNQFVAPTADLSINSHKLTSVTDPTSAQDAATKAYVDSGTKTVTNTRVTRRVETLADAATVTPNADSADGGKISELSQATTLAAPSGTPTAFQPYVLRMKSTTARALTWNAIYRAATDLALPTTTVAGKWLYLVFQYNADDTKWDFVGQPSATGY